MDQDNGKKWEMPEPIFRQSTGELVTPSEGEYFDPEPDTLEPNSAEETPSASSHVEPHSALGSVPDPPTASAPPSPAPDDPLARLYDPPVKAAGSTGEAHSSATTPAVAVEPQPFISEQFTAEKIVVDKGVAQPKGSGRSIWAVIALLIILAAAAGLAALVYLMFYAARTDTSGF